MKPPLIRKDLVYPELSYKLIGYAYEVFNELGPGHSEKTYTKAYAIMLRKNGHKFKEQVYYPVRFKNEVVNRAFLDFVVEEIIVIEMKKNVPFSKTHIDQVLEYIKNSKLKLAILTSFTNDGVRFKRIVNVDQTITK